MKKQLIFLLLFFINVPKINSNNFLYFMNAKHNEALNPEFLKQLKRFFDIDTFIETGTYLGDTCKVASTIFNQVHSIELDIQLYLNALNLFKNNNNVHIHHGNSKDVLPNILNKLHNKILFFLDAHWSEGITAKGPEITPILPELKIIKESKINDAVILVDDIRYFQENEIIQKEYNKSESIFGYPTLDSLKQHILDINKDYEIVIFGDILLAFIPNGKVEISPVLKALTISRFNDINNLNQETLVAINAIASATNIEQQAIQELALRHNFLNMRYITRYYKFWHSLILLHSNQDLAKKILNELGLQVAETN